MAGRPNGTTKNINRRGLLILKTERLISKENNIMS